ncbi:MAG TPA: RNA polymerase sigma factor [Thermoanaerobaculia bacterium]|nr:RNA polymerase sigma factor [Thermoanaerobaculia bacterium]
MTGALVQPLAFSRLRDGEAKGVEQMRRAAGDPFDWSRRQVAAQYRTVYRVALAVLGPGGEAEAEEVAQEAFLRLHAERHRFRGESRVSTWLHRVAFRLAVDRRRRPSRKHVHVGEEHLDRRPANASAEDPFETTHRAERAENLERAIQRLSETQQAVIRLHYWLDTSVAEISEHLGLPVGTVKSHLYRGRAALADLLAEKIR